jgi:hypothetical protein
MFAEFFLVRATDAARYPRLNAADLAALSALAEPCSFKDGEAIFQAGQCDLDLFVVECGGIDIINPSDNDRHIVTHSVGEFSGDIDLLTGVDALSCGRWPPKDREPCPLETTLPRVLAAGDIRAGSTKRVGFAVGDGSLAVTCVHKLTAIRR